MTTQTLDRPPARPLARVPSMPSRSGPMRRPEAGALLGQATLRDAAQVSAGRSVILASIIAAVVDERAAGGGHGSVVGIALGTLTFAVVNPGILHAAFDANRASLIIGVLFLAAVLTNSTFGRLALSAPPPQPRADLADLDRCLRSQRRGDRGRPPLGPRGAPLRHPPEPR